MAVYSNQNYSGLYFTQSYENSGALKLADAEIIIENCSFNDNGGRQFSTYGGAIATFDEAVQSVTISNTTFSNNYAQHGGAIAASKTLNLIDVTFTNNHAEPYSYAGYGGAIFIQGCRELNYTVTSGHDISNQGNYGAIGGFLHDHDGQSVFTFDVQSNASLTIGATNTSTDSINLHKGSKLIKTGAGTMTINSVLERRHPYTNEGSITDGDITVESGILKLNRGGTFDGSVKISGGQLDLGANYSFTSVEFELGNGTSLAMVSDWSKLSATRITIDISEAAAGSYVLAANAGTFNRSVTITDNEVSQTISSGQSVTIGGTLYSLNVANGNLTLTAGGGLETGSLVVTTAADIEDANDGVTSLREAVSYARSLGGEQTITFNIAEADTLVLDNTIKITTSVIIDGTNSATGNNVTLRTAVTDAEARQNNSAASDYVLLNFSGANLTLNDLTLMGGNQDVVSFEESAEHFYSDGLTIKDSSRQIGGDYNVDYADINHFYSVNCAFGLGFGKNAVVRNSTFDGSLIHGSNEVNGGLLGLNDGSTLTVINSTLLNNDASHSGSAMYIGTGSTVNLVNTTIENARGYLGYGNSLCSVLGGQFNLLNTIVVTPDGWRTPDIGAAFGSSNTIRYSVYGTTSSANTAANSYSGYDSEDLFVTAGQTSDNGGVTPTITILRSADVLNNAVLAAVDPETHTLYYSTDNGSSWKLYSDGSAANVDAAWIIDTDQNGISRLTGNKIGASVVTDAEPAPITDPLIVTTAEDVVDANDGKTSLSEAITYALSLGGEQTIGFNMKNGDTVYINDPSLVSRNIRFDQTNVANGNFVTVVLNELSISGRSYSNPEGVRLGSGAVAFIYEDDITVIGGDYSNNRDTGTGGYGGAFRVVDGTLTVDGTTFTNNYAYSGGGAINLDNGSVTIRNSHFEGNNVYGFGGALVLYGGSDGEVIDTDFVNNYTRHSTYYGWSGGAISIQDGNLVYTVSAGKTITNTGNDATYGGFIHVGAGAAASATVDFRVDGLLNIGSGDGKDSFVSGSGDADRGDIIRKTGSGTMTINAPVSDYNGKWIIEDGILAFTYASGGDFDGDITISGGQMALGGGAYTFSKLTFALSEANETAYISNLANLTGGTFTVDAGDAEFGTYLLAGNAANFNSAISLTVGDDSYADALTVGNSYTVGERDYSLAVDGSNALTLTVASNSAPDPLIVTTAEDVVDANDGKTSLREAITYALSLGGEQTIGFNMKNGDTVYINDPSLVSRNIRFAPTNAANDNPVTVVLNELSISGRRISRSEKLPWGDGGGAVMFLNSSNISVVGGEYSNNRDLGTGGAGGVFRLWDSATLTVDDATFQNNYAYSTGGAIIADKSSVTIRNSHFVGNSVAGYGGAVDIDRGNCIIIDTDFVNNSTGHSGSSWFWSGGAINLECSNLVYEVSADKTISNTGNDSSYGGFLVLRTLDDTACLAEFKVDGTLNIGTGNGKDSIVSGTQSKDRDHLIRKTGSGTMTINAPVSDYKGKWVIEDGVLAFAYASGGSFSGDITISGGQMGLDGGAYTFSKLTFALSEANETAYISNLANLTGGTFTVDAGDAEFGTYLLAGNAAGFNSAISLKVGEDTFANALTVGNSYTVGGREYTLGRNSDNVLTLNIASSGTPAPAKSLVVTTAADVVDANDGVTSLREAIAAAEAGITAEDGSYTITFDPSLKGKTISWGSRHIVGDNIFTNSRNPLVVNGDIDGNGTADITLQGNGSERFFTTDFGNYINFNGLSFTGGYELNGGAIETGAYLTVSNCVFSDNKAGNGGGAILVSNGLLTAVNSIFEGNYAWYGGAVFTAWDGKAEILDSTFTNNSTRYESCGGAIQNGWWCNSNANSVSVVNCVLVGNSVYDIVNESGKTASVDYSVLTSASGVSLNSTNYTGYSAGDVLNTDFTLKDSTSNPAVSYGVKTGISAGGKAVYSLNGTTWHYADDSTCQEAVTAVAADYAGAVRGNPYSIGAFQLGGSTPARTDFLVVTTAENVVDANDGVTSLREAFTYAQTLGGEQTITFNIQNTDEILSHIEISFNGNHTIDGRNASTGNQIKSQANLMLYSGMNIENYTVSNDWSDRLYGDLYLYTGTSGKNLTVEKYGDLYAVNASCENITVLENGSFSAFSSEIRNVDIAYKGILIYSSGNTIEGNITIQGAVAKKTRNIVHGDGTPNTTVGADSQVTADTHITFDLSGWEPGLSMAHICPDTEISNFSSCSHAMLIDNMKVFTGAGSYTVSVNADQALGTYNLAGNAADFNSAMSLMVGEDTYADALTVGSSYTVGERDYSLAVDSDNVLTLNITASVTPTPADSLVVTTAEDVVDANDGVTSLREAIAAASSNASLRGADGQFTITFADDIFTGDTATITLGSVLTIDENIFTESYGELVIQGNTDGKSVILDGNSKVQILLNNTGNTVTLDSLTVRNGRGVDNSNSWAGISNCGTMTIRDSLFTGNSASRYDGALRNSGTLTVTGSTFSRNSSGWGDGAIKNATENSIMTIDGCLFTENHAKADGGAITNHGLMTITDSLFSNNSAGTGGGAICNWGGTMTVSTSTISGNSAMYGGAVFNYSGALLTVADSTITGNTAGSSGAVNNSGSTLKLVNSIVIGNNISGRISVDVNNLFDADATVAEVFAEVDENGKAVLNADGTIHILADGKAAGTGVYVWHNEDYSAIAYSETYRGSKTAVLGNIEDATILSTDQLGNVRTTSSTDIGAVLSTRACNDPTDPDDEISEARLLTASVKGSVENARDVDLYAFTVNADEKIILQTAADGDNLTVDTYLRLFDADGNELASDDDGGVNHYSRLGYTFREVGTYYVGVSYYTNTGYDVLTGGNDRDGKTGSYELSLSRLGYDDSDDQLSEANFLAEDATAADKISYGSDVDMYSFSVEENDIKRFYLDSPDGADLYMRIFSATGKELATGVSELEYSFGQAGTYYIGISGGGNREYDPGSGTGDTETSTPDSYELRYETQEGRYDDPDDKLSTANVAESNNLVLTGELEAGTDVDMYKFTVRADEELTFSLSGTAGGTDFDSYLRLFDAEGRQLSFNDDDESGSWSQLTYRSEEDGTVYLGISANGNTDYNPLTGEGDVNSETGDYTLTVRSRMTRTVFLSSATDLGAVTLSGPVVSSASIDRPNQINMYSFDVSAGDTVWINLDNLAGSNLDSYFRLFDADGTQLAFNDDGAAAGESSRTCESYLEYTFTEAGKYYLGVSSYGNQDYEVVLNALVQTGNSTGTYRLAFGLITEDTDDDDTLDSATALSNAVHSDTLDSATDVDMYKVTLRRGETLTATITLHGLVDSYLRLFDAQGNELAANDDGGFKGKANAHASQIVWQAQEDGVYYLGVSGYGNTVYNPIDGSQDKESRYTGNYSIKAQIKAARNIIADDSYENNDTMASAASLGTASGILTVTSLTMNDKADWYKFTTANDTGVESTVSLASSDSSANLSLSVYQSDGTLVGYAVDGRTGVSLANLFAGDYYIQVTGSETDDYSISLNVTAAPTASAANTAENYVVLFSGGYNALNNRSFYYDSIKRMYEIATQTYGVAADHVYILYADGTNRAPDNSRGQNSDMSFAAGSVVLSATASNLRRVFGEIAAAADGNDHFLFYSFDHGFENCRGKDYLCGWGEMISDTDFAVYAEEINAGYQTYLMAECFSGGMIEDLTIKSNLYAASSSDVYKPTSSLLSPITGKITGGFSKSVEDALASGINTTYALYQNMLTTNPCVYFDNPQQVGADITIFAAEAEQKNLIIDSYDSYGEVTINRNSVPASSFVNKNGNYAPVITAFDIFDEEAYWSISQAEIGSTVALSVKTYDPDSEDTVAKVEFYYTDAAGKQQLIAVDNDGNDGWQYFWTLTNDLTQGYCTLAAVSQDSYGNYSQFFDLDFRILEQNFHPEITSIALDAASYLKGQTVTVSGIARDSDSNGIDSVRIYFDSDKDGFAAYPDEFLGLAQVNPDGSWNYSFTLDSSMEIGSYTIFAEAVDSLDMLTGQAVGIDFLVSDIYVSNLEISTDFIQWKKTSSDVCVIEYSQDTFQTAFGVASEGTSVDVIDRAGGEYQVRARYETAPTWNDSLSVSFETPAEGPVRLVSTANGAGDIFFAGSSQTWGSRYHAQHSGSVNDWSGTGERTALSGKNKIVDIFEGSSDANILALTDDANGDALFVDDIYSAFPDEQQARIAQINEIRAGAGDDIVDMTSQRFEYTGDGLIIRGGSGNDTIWANKGGNFLFGDAGNDRLVGASGNDVLAGGSGNDSMHGGGGDDIFAFGINWGADTVEQLNGGSVTLWFESGDFDKWNAGSCTYTDGQNSVTVSGVTADQVTLKFGSDDSVQFDLLSDLGVFSDYSSENIFEENGKGILACL